MSVKHLLLTLLIFSAPFQISNAQTTNRPRPAQWENLIFGGRFMDRFLPMRNNGTLTKDTWGDDNVLPRYIDNGIENKKWSFWCASIKKVDGKYHMFTAGWRESSPKGHAAWPGSTVFHAVSENMDGPYTVKDTIGPGHNPEVYQLKDGRWVLYVIDSYYVSKSIIGPWEAKKFDFQNRDRQILDGLSNCTFAQREDGSYLMINRGGETWFSKTGDSTYSLVTEKSAYPPIKGNFEDPVVWRDNVQYNLIVNDWLGRIAYYLRSKDGVDWKVESGEAYMPGISVHQDGKVEAWHKYERMQVLKDEYGRAVQANFAVIDVEKKFDQANDNHSSKVITIPLAKARMLTIINKEPITAATKTIQVRVAAEPGFDPQTDMELNSLHFGGSEAVNYGKGGKVLKIEKAGKDLIISFDGRSNDIPADDYVAKLIGKTSQGELLYGYARLPGVDFIEPILSAKLPVITPGEKGLRVHTEIQNFGQVESKPTEVKVTYMHNGKQQTIGGSKVPALKPFEKVVVEFNSDEVLQKGVSYEVIVAVNPSGKNPAILHGRVTPMKL